MARIRFDNPNEVARFHAQESWVPVVLGGIPIALLCAVACAAVYYFAGESYIPYAIGASVLITLISRLPHMIDNWMTDAVITDRRLYYRRGIIKVRDHVCDLSTITDIAVEPTVLGRIFNYADITIQTQAGDDDFVLKEIRGAYKMRKAINVGRDFADGPSTPPTRPRQQRRGDLRRRV